MAPKTRAAALSALILAGMPLASAYADGLPKLWSSKVLSWRSAGSLRQKDADAALHEVLSLSLTGAVRQLSSAESFSEGSPHHINLPQQLAAMRGDWNVVGRSGALGKLDDAMNRAAAGVIAASGPIFQQQAVAVDFYDSVAVVRSGDRAASRFYAMRTRAALEASLAPVVEQALSSAGAYSALTEAAQAAGNASKAADYRPMVASQTLAGVLDALFDETGRIEADIRAAPAGRGSDLLNDVFTSALQTASGSPGG